MLRWLFAGCLPTGNPQFGARHTVSVCTELGVPDEPKRQVMQMLWGARDEVLDRPAAAGV